MGKSLVACGNIEMVQDEFGCGVHTQGSDLLRAAGLRRSGCMFLALIWQVPLAVALARPGAPIGFISASLV